jgi:cytochrome c
MGRQSRKQQVPEAARLPAALTTAGNEGEENVRKHDVRGESKTGELKVGLKIGAVRNGGALIVALALACLTGAAARADSDAAKGKAAFVRQCAICHTVDKDGDNRMGPNLFGIVGKKAGTVPGFTYTNAFKTRANWEWSEDAVGGWMMFPSTMVPGTAMAAFQGIAETDRDDLVAYLATLK